eukprot:6463369-Amphidinium_carterae.4
MNKSGSELPQQLQEAERVSENPTLKTWKPQSVTGTQSHVMELQKSYVVLTANELRKALQVERLKKSHTQGVPVVVLMNQSGSLEEHYVFTDPAKPWKTLNVKTEHSIGWDVHELCSENQTWAKQAERVHEHSQTSLLSSSRVGSLVNSPGVLSLDEHLQKVATTERLAEAGPEASDGDGDANLPDDEEVACAYVGSAAAAAVAVASATLTSAPSIGSCKKAKVQVTTPETDRSKGQSVSSLGEDMEDGDEDAMSHAGQSLISCTTTGHGKEGSGGPLVGETLLEIVSDDALRGDSIEFWRAKLPVWDVLTEPKMGRQVESFRRSVHHREEKGKPNAAVLRNYLKVLESARFLYDGCFKSCSEDELQSHLQKIELEKVNLPVPIQLKLCKRSAELAMESRNFGQLVQTLNPFENTTWDRVHPSLSAVKAAEGSMLATYEEVFLQSVLKPIVQQGQIAKDQVKTVAGIFLNAWADIDPVELSNPAAQCLSNCTAICETLLALVDERLNTRYQASVTKVHNHIGKAVKGPLVETASMLEGSDFWQVRLHEYVSDLPSQLQCEAEMLEVFAAFDGMEHYSRTDFPKIESIVSKLAAWRSSLRRSSMRDIEQKVSAKVEELVCSVLNDKQLDDLRALQPLMAEMCIAFPMSKTLDEYKTQLAEELLSFESEEANREVEKLCDMSLKEETLMKAIPYLKDFVVVISKLASQSLSEDLELRLKSLVTDVMGKVQLLVQIGPLSLEHVSEVTVVVDLLRKVAIVLSDEKVSKLGGVLQNALDLQGKKLGAKATDASDLQMLRQLCLKLSQSVKELHPLLDSKDSDSWLAGCRTILETSQKELDSQVDKLEKTAHGKVTTTVETLSKKMLKTKKWFAADSVKSWQALTTLYKDTLQTVAPMELEGSRNMVAEADIICPYLPLTNRPYEISFLQNDSNKAD